MTWSDEEARERVARLEALLGGLDGPALEAAAGLVEVYGEALRRVVAAVGAQRLAGDELVGHLLMIHDLHPSTVEERVSAALDDIGGGAELAGIDGATARVRLPGGCGGCGRPAVEEAVGAAAPEIERVEVLGDEPGIALPMAVQAAGA